MVGYHIKIGYNANRPYQDAWELLKKVVRNICDNPQMIAEETRRLGFVGAIEMYTDYYAKSYDEYGHPITIIEGDEQIMQLASTTPDTTKYHVRRAFVRLVIQEMHRFGVEVCLNVC